jgi:hypothetical protein
MKLSNMNPIVVKRTIEKALTFLRNKKTHTFAISESPRFESSHRIDSPFAASIAIYSLARVEKDKENLLSPCLEHLAQTMIEPSLWSFSRSSATPLPPDTDTTCCVLIALKLLGIDGIDFEKAASFLLKFRDNRGLFYTWLVEDILTTNIPLKRNDVDPVVNTNALHFYHLLGKNIPEVSSYIINFVMQNGLELRSHSLYYNSPLLFAYFLSRAIAFDKEGFLTQIIPIVEEEITKRVQNPDDALGAALALSSLIKINSKEPHKEQLLQFITSSQQSDGSFPIKPMFRDLSNWYYGTPELTTALCIEALSQSRAFSLRNKPLRTDETC